MCIRDRLAAGKGVTVAQTLDQAKDAIEQALNDNKFGEAGSEIVIEECLIGEEASFHVLVDGENVIPLASAQDHKAAGEGDTGPNTGGMGAYSPVPLLTNQLEDKIKKKIIEPTLKAMKDLGYPYKGFLYAGLMIKDNEPYLIDLIASDDACPLPQKDTVRLIIEIKSPENQNPYFVGKNQ